MTQPDLAIRQKIGIAARVVQRQHLQFRRVTVDTPVLITVKRGRKELRSPGFCGTLDAGEAIAITYDQVFDITNTPSSSGEYQAD